MSPIAINVRRKPRQSRAKFTQQALLQSTVQLLHEKSFADITIREITDIAGVGLGTFYEYFSQKEDVIALIIHQSIKQNIQTLQQLAEQALKQQHMSLADYLHFLIQQQLHIIREQQRIWAMIFLLERQLSTLENYQKHYEMMIDVWHQILLPYQLPAQQQSRLAINLQHIVYGYVMHSLLIQPDFQSWDLLEQDIGLALSGFLNTIPCNQLNQRG